MALTTTAIMPKDITVKFRDATSPTPLELAFLLTEGTITFTDGEFEHVLVTDSAGVPLSGSAPRQAGVRGFCGVTLNGTLFDAGDNGTDANYLDLIKFDGVIASTPWVSTTTSPDANIKTWDIQVVIADRGAVKGGTYEFPDCRLVGQFGTDGSRDAGFKVSGHEWQSVTTVKFTNTRTP